MMSPYGPIGNAMQQGPQAMPVHSSQEVQQRFKKKGMAVPQPIQQMTQMYEQAPEGPIKQKLHADQHQMLLSNQNAQNQAKRMQMQQQMMQLQQMSRALRTQGRIEEADQVDHQLRALSGMLEGLPGMGGAEGPQ